MTAFVRKAAEDAVLREDWHENEDGSRLLLLKYPLLERTGIVEHCFTTRLGGVSADIFSTMNLSFPEAMRRLRCVKITGAWRGHSGQRWGSLSARIRHIPSMCAASRQRTPEKD